MKKVKMICMVILIASMSGAVHSQENLQPDGSGKTRDELRAAVQEICPVSGNRLGEHGPPLKVEVGKDKEQVFLCCKGCTKGKINPEHWATIHKNIARAQGKCPVMGKPLPEKPEWTIVQGQVVFVCCPPCTEKIVGDEKAYLQKVNRLYMAAIQRGRSSQ